MKSEQKVIKSSSARHTNSYSVYEMGGKIKKINKALTYPVPSLNFFCLSFHMVQIRDSEKSSALTRFDCHRACARKCKQT